MNKQRITLSAFLAYFCTSGMLSTIGLVSGPMATHFGVSVTDITSNFGWLTFGLLLGAALALYVVERFPLRIVQLCGFVLIAGALAALRIVADLHWVWPLLGVVGTCLGIGLAAAASTIAGSYAEDQRASMLVITDASFSVAGWVCAGLTLYFIGESMHWSSGYLVVGAVAVVVVGLAATSVFPGQQTTARVEGVVGTRVGWPIGVWLCIGALCLYTLGQYAMLWWLPQHLQGTLAVPPQEAGVVVGRFWAGMFVAQLFVSWWVLKIGVRRLVLISSVSAALLSLPMWLVGDAALIPWLGALWGFGNLAFLKIGLSFATQLQLTPSPRLVSALLFGATSGTAISPFITSRIVENFGTQAVLQFSSVCYFGIVLLMVSVLLKSRSA